MIQSFSHNVSAQLSSAQLIAMQAVQAKPAIQAERTDLAGESLVVSSTPAEGVQLLALNRISKRNALSQELIRVFLDRLAAASMDDSVRVIVVTGSTSFFCGGSKT